MRRSQLQKPTARMRLRIRPPHNPPCGTVSRPCHAVVARSGDLATTDLEAFCKPTLPVASFDGRSANAAAHRPADRFRRLYRARDTATAATSNIIMVEGSGTVPT